MNSELSVRFTILEGLRGLMAWWVVFGHFLGENGFEAGLLPSFLRLAATPEYAVDIFVMLSGFVISHLLIEKQPQYRIYIGKRFMRLYPLFIACVFVGFFSFDWIRSIYQSFQASIPVHAQPESLWVNISENRWQHLAISSTLLHGVVPQAWLPDAQAAFVPPAWSVSLEWQFYLVFPLLLTAFRSYPVLSGLLVAIIVVIRRHYAIGDWGSFLPHHAEYFAIGILSYLAFRKLIAFSHQTGHAIRWTGWTVLLLLLIVEPLHDFFVRPYETATGIWIPLTIWLMAMALLVETQCVSPGRFAQRAAALLNSKPAQYLGKISYSTYLVHYFAIYIAMAVALQLPIPLNKYSSLATMLAIAFPLTLLGSALCYRLIEQPGIRLGERLFPSKTNTSRASTAPISASTTS